MTRISHEEAAWHIPSLLEYSRESASGVQRSPAFETEYDPGLENATQKIRKAQETRIREEDRYVCGP